MKNDEYVLYHHGVKGMKWGVHKDRLGSLSGSSTLKTRSKSGGSAKKVKKQGSSSASEKKPSLSDHEKAQKIKAKSLDQMSNQEIEFLLRRQRLEKSYKELNPPEVSKGKKIVAGVAAVGTTVLAAVTKADQVYNAYQKILKIDKEFKVSENVSNLLKKK